MSNNTAILVNDCPTDSIMDANLDAWYSTATINQLNDGIGWYQRARIYAANLAIKHHVTTEVVVAIIAALSPMTEWGINCTMAEAILENPDAETIDGVRRFVGYPANIDKARRIARTHDVSILSGQKVERFYAAILGIDTIPTIDSWATRAATMRMDVDGPGACYDAIARAYTRFAIRHNLDIHDAQAIIWSVIRKHGQAGKTGTRRVRAS